VPGGVDFLFAQAADEGTAAGHAGEMAFLVGPRSDIDAEPGAGRVFGKSPCDFEAVDHAHDAIEPAAARLRVGMRSHQQPRALSARTADDIADPVDGRAETGRLHAGAEPVPRLDVLGRKMGTMNAAFVAAEFGDPAQITQ